MKKYGLKYHIHMGRKSNYPPCCVMWFLFKIQLFKLLVHYKFKFKFLHRPAFRRVKRQHACCLYHFVKAAFKPPSYSRCNVCNWQQLSGKDCMKCRE